MRQGPSSNGQQQREMCVEVTLLKVQEALFAIDDNKAPGINSFNAHFFEKAWGIIKIDVYNAVQEFFEDTRMLRAVNNTIDT